MPITDYGFVMGKPLSRTDDDHMRHALTLADRGVGMTTPNPSVGCVIVKNNRIIGRGWTQPGGRPHGEFMALSQAGDEARDATLYTTLEPCAHVSERGPSCSSQILSAGIAKVVMAMHDPDPRTSGKGHEALAASGMTVINGVLQKEAQHFLRAFTMRLAGKRPWVTLKLAVTMDGFIAQEDGTSKWITGEESRAHAHLMRARSDAIIIGRGTSDADNPKLDVRLPGLEQRSPQPIILSKSSSTSSVPNARVVAAPDMPFFLSTLAGEGMLNVIVEGGAATAAQFLTADLVDEIHLYRAPVLLGQGRHMSHMLDGQKLDEAHELWKMSDSRSLGADQLTVYLRSREI
jgi:diaminohydroxyphosphoribosylaminopyrimidine deaminase / 5-amino-6-(5-phosphoribosylamino)uracil reductase